MDDMSPDKEHANSVTGAEGAEQLWAVHIEGPGETFAMVSRAAADKYVSRINDRYQSLALSDFAQERVDARVIVSPWRGAEHWRNCALAQAGLLEELENQAESASRAIQPRAMLVPDKDLMAAAWFGSNRMLGESIPPEVRDYTMRLLTALPARPSQKEASAPSVEDTVRSALGSVLGQHSKLTGRLSLPRNPTALAPGHLREIIQVLVREGWVRPEPIDDELLNDDEQCREDFYAAQISGQFGSGATVEVWRAAYAAALNRCSAKLMGTIE